MYEESELSFFDSEIGARLQHSLIFQQQDDDCASDDENIDYGKNRTLKSLKQSILMFANKDKSFVSNYTSFV